MVGVYRSFSSDQFSPGTSPEEFHLKDPIGSVSGNVSLDKGEKKLLVATNDFHYDGQPHTYRVLTFIIEVSDWSDIEDLLNVLNHYLSNNQHHQYTQSISATKVVSWDSISYDDESSESEPDLEFSTYEDVSVRVTIGSPWVEWAISPEPDDPVFPVIPIGTQISPGTGASDTIHLEGFADLLSEAVHGIRDSISLDPIFDEKTKHTIMGKEHGPEVIAHIDDGDSAFHDGRNHQALSSYIHAFEWAAIAYLETKGIDIIEREREGDLYYFAGGNSNLLDELRQVTTIDQKTVSKLESMNRAERRWMAHHKKGEVLSSEVEAIRDRLKLFTEDLFTN